MNQRLSELREETLKRAFKKYRTGPDADPGRWAFLGSGQRQVTELFKLRCREERPVVLKDERIAFMRSRNSIAVVRTDTSWLAQQFRRMRTIPMRLVRKVFRIKPKSENLLHWRIYNTTIDWATLLAQGLGGRIAVAQETLSLVCDAGEREFLCCAIEGLEALCELVNRYAEEAKKVGNIEVAAVLKKVWRGRPEHLQEALQLMRIVQYGLYLQGMEHCGLGRIDQYLRSFYEQDLLSGWLTRESAKELLEEFFIDLNRDADLYPGVQQGDNGQSVMLGGCEPKTGESAVNDLTYLIIEAVLETRLIDPKINLRVDRNTPVDLLELGSELTKCGLGFPQYSNDEVVIPALVKKGYSLEDARDYSVAACWEFVIPGKAMDFVNVGAVSFPYAVDKALRDEVAVEAFSEESFRRRIRENIVSQLQKLVDRKDVWHSVPFLSAFFAGTLESGRDITECAKYRNLGVHGAGAANAADQLAAVIRVDKLRRCGFEKPMSSVDRVEAARRIVTLWHEKVTRDTFKSALQRLLDEKAASGDYCFRRLEERQCASALALKFFDDFSEKIVKLSDGRCVYFTPDERSRRRNAGDLSRCWAEYAFHAVSSSGKILEGKGYCERLFNSVKAADMVCIERVLKDEQCMYRVIDAHPENDSVIFMGFDDDGFRLEIVTRLDVYGNAQANLSEVTVMVKRKRKKETPPPMYRPLTEVVEAVAKHQAAGFSPSTTKDNIAKIRDQRKGGICSEILSLKRLVKAQDRDFDGDEELRRFLLEECPKVGNADPVVDGEMKFLFDAFADAADKLSRPERQIRPGSGTAMFYIWLTDTRNPRAKGMLEPVVGATSDGRKRDAPLASSLAPAHEAKVGGILSVLKSFSVIDYSRVMNGGPITIEFSHMVFKTPEGVKKLAQLIRYFVQLGCQQLQLNVLNVEELEDALIHPELHRNLVVRVWGWSGYFCELDHEFQMQIIKRHRYGI